MRNGNITIAYTQSTLFHCQGIKLDNQLPRSLPRSPAHPLSASAPSALAYLSNRSKCFIVTLPHTYTHTHTDTHTPTRTCIHTHVCKHLRADMHVCVSKCVRVLGIQSSVSFLSPSLSPQSTRMPINGLPGEGGGKKVLVGCLAGQPRTDVSDGLTRIGAIVNLIRT